MYAATCVAHGGSKNSPPPLNLIEKKRSTSSENTLYRLPVFGPLLIMGQVSNKMEVLIMFREEGWGVFFLILRYTIILDFRTCKVVNTTFVKIKELLINFVIIYHVCRDKIMILHEA